MVGPVGSEKNRGSVLRLSRFTRFHAPTPACFALALLAPFFNSFHNTLKNREAVNSLALKGLDYRFQVPVSARQTLCELGRS